MRKQNLRKVRWDRERNRAYVVRGEVRYWAPEYTRLKPGDAVGVFNPARGAITVRLEGISETWRADATPPGSGG